MDILKNSGFPIKPVETMEQAVKDVVSMVKEKSKLAVLLTKESKIICQGFTGAGNFSLKEPSSTIPK